MTAVSAGRGIVDTIVDGASPVDIIDDDVVVIVIVAVDIVVVSFGIVIF